MYKKLQKTTVTAITSTPKPKKISLTVSFCLFLSLAGNPSPLLPQATTDNFCLSTSATGDTSALGGNNPN